MKVYYFGYWNAPGHFLHAPGGRRAHGAEMPAWGEHRWPGLDALLAPRRRHYGNELTWLGEHAPHNTDFMKSRSEECQQGQFLRHVLDNGFTALAWWDRCQGDERGACNSVFLLEGVHDTPTMLAALREHFPHVVANLERHGVELVEVAP